MSKSVSVSPTVCSIATPRSGTPLGTETSSLCSWQFQRKLQDTRDRLTALESEQRRLLDSSLGALVKAAADLEDDCTAPRGPDIVRHSQETSSLSNLVEENRRLRQAVLQ